MNTGKPLTHSCPHISNLIVPGFANPFYLCTESRSLRFEPPIPHSGHFRSHRWSRGSQLHIFRETSEENRRTYCVYTPLPDLTQHFISITNVKRSSKTEPATVHGNLVRPAAFGQSVYTVEEWNVKINSKAMPNVDLSSYLDHGCFERLVLKR